jgi:hypothetical protein
VSSALGRNADLAARCSAISGRSDRVGQVRRPAGPPPGGSTTGSASAKAPSGRLALRHPRTPTK